MSRLEQSLELVVWGSRYLILVAVVASIVVDVVALLTAIMLIFALGLYELFIGKIEAAENSEVAARLLV
ncbi:MAG: YqhA family protein [Armatimonadota bacterium]|nr:YqhA family protein [Armatimonadota bacterium]